MIKFKFFFAAFFASLSIISCEPDVDNLSDSNNNGFSNNFGNQVSRDFIGQIVDVNKNSIQNATVTIGNKMVQTDSNGVFVINAANVYEQFAHIKATKVGYIDGSRSLVPTSGKNNVRIMMISNTPIQTIQSGEIRNVILPNGTKVKFDGAFQDSDGRPYSGAVQVSMFHLKPSDENISFLMPGMLYAEDNNGEEKVLETFGMLNVELKGSVGQKLQIAAGHTAEITVQIDDSQLTTAPNTIPLWHFDELNGYWKEEGSATKVGNKYVGNVSHFSWWNCDIQSSTVILSVKIVNELNIPLPNIKVLLERNGGSDSRFSYSNNIGEISGMIPANETFIMNFFNNCDDIISSTIIGPFSNDTILSNIIIDSSQIQTSIITGSLLKCDNSKVTNGYVIIQYENQLFISSVNDGKFSATILNCQSNSVYTLFGFDSENNQISAEINGIFTNLQTNIGSIVACNSIVNNTNLIGLYTVVVTRDDGNSRTFTNELITFINSNTYKTATTGLWAIGELSVGSTMNQGFKFINTNGNLQVVSQNLAEVYSNVVKGIDSNNDIDGVINNNNSFQINYEVTNPSNPLLTRTYIAVYTRN
jgi:hypothetical protein